MHYRTEQRPEDAVATWADGSTEHPEAVEPALTVGELVDAVAANEIDRSQPVRLDRPDSTEIVVCGVRSQSASAPGLTLLTRPATSEDHEPSTATVTSFQLATLLTRWITGYCGHEHPLLTAVNEDLATELIHRAGTAQRGQLQVIARRALRRLVGSGRLHRPDALRYALIGAIGAPRGH